MKQDLTGSTKDLMRLFCQQALFMWPHNQTPPRKLFSAIDNRNKCGCGQILNCRRLVAMQLAREFAVFGLDWNGMKSDELCSVCIPESKDQDIAVVHGDSCVHCVCFWCLVFSNLAMTKRQAAHLIAERDLIFRGSLKVSCYRNREVGLLTPTLFASLAVSCCPAFNK